MLPSEKTGELNYIIISPKLSNIIKNSPTGDMAIIATLDGKPMKKESFGNWFRAACNQADVKKSAHGLRKLAASMLAEAGATDLELQAAFGWTTGKMSSFYTRAASRKELSKTASIKRISRGK